MISQLKLLNGRITYNKKIGCLLLLPYYLKRQIIYYGCNAPLAQLDRVPVFGTGGEGSSPSRGITLNLRKVYEIN